MSRRATTQLALWLGATMALTACHDLTSPQARNTAVPRFASGTSTETAGMPVQNRFRVTLQASGAFRPNTPITIRASVAGRTDVVGARLTILLPEVAAAEASDWGPGFRYPVGTRTPPQLTRTVNVARSTTIQEETTVRFQAPGYYHVIAVVEAPDAYGKVENGRWVRNSAVAQAWLLITEDGGRITLTFEPELIPAGMDKSGGPFRARRPVRDASLTEEVEHRSGPYAAGAPTDYITYEVIYYNVLAQQYQPLEGAYEVLGCTKEEWQIICEEYQFEPITSGYTGSNGLFYILGCDFDEYEGTASTYAATSVRVNSGVASFDGDVSSDCGNSFQTIVPSNQARVFLHMRATISGTYSKFGTTRSFIDVWLDGDTSYVSHYSPSNDDITIVIDDIWVNGWSEFVAAHEYGHAFHEDALGGNTGGNCPSPHYIDTESSLECAFSEGFADYFGAVTRPDLGTYYYRTYLEADNAFPGCVSRNASHQCTGGTSYEGSTIEGAYAAFLYDVSDDITEAHDSVAAPGSYVASLIQTCQVTYGLWFRANGPDEVAFCAENSINPGSYFTVRGATPSAYSESATESGGWTASRVNRMWRWNMYEKS